MKLDRKSNFKTTLRQTNTSARWNESPSQHGLANLLMGGLENWEHKSLPPELKHLTQKKK